MGIGTKWMQKRGMYGYGGRESSGYGQRKRCRYRGRVSCRYEGAGEGNCGGRVAGT